MKPSRRTRNPTDREIPAVLDRKLIGRLAWFRYHLRRFLRFSEKAARAEGVTPQQHQLLLGIAGYTDRDWATIGELAEFLQERHNAVVGLVERAAKRGLVVKVQGEPDHRFVHVHLTVQGEAALIRLSQLHREEAGRLASRMFATSHARPQTRRPRAISEGNLNS